MTDYVFQQTIIQWRIPIKDDGTLGNPEIMRKFTSEIKGSQSTHKMQGTQSQLKLKEQEMKTKEQEKALSRLSTTIGEAEEL